VPGVTSATASPSSAPAPPPADRPGRPGRPGRLVLLRHGRTAWAHSGQHTGRTDIPLDEVGVAQARALPPLLSALCPGEPALVVSSPLVRARRTAELAGLSAITTDEDLVEWDYGAYEGLTTPQIRELRGGDAWTVFADGVAPGQEGSSAGESLEDVAARTGAVIERVRPHLADGDVVLVAHGHSLRVLATVWLGLPPQAGAQLLLDPASVCVLDVEHGVPGIRHWNLTPALFGSPSS